MRAWARPGPAVTRHLPRGLGTPHLTGLGARNPRLACLPYHHFACPSSMWTLGRRAWLLPPRSTWSQAGTGQAATRKKGQLGSLILCPWSHKALLPGPRRSSRSVWYKVRANASLATAGPGSGRRRGWPARGSQIFFGEPIMTFDTKLTMALAGCSGSCSANRWHTLSVALPCFRATNPKTL